MYTLLQSPGLRKKLLLEVPSLGISILTAEALYKFHSFVLECVAFLATWFVVSYLLSRIPHKTEKQLEISD
jgi:hypothetical protein